MDARALAARFGTPVFACDEADFRERCRDFRQAFGDEAGVFYAAKAFCCRAVLRWVSEEGLGVDVCTGGELEVALQAGVEPEMITMHGSNKLTAELDRAVAAGVGHIVVDSFDEIGRLATIAEGRGGRAAGSSPAGRPKLLVRVTTGVEAAAHEFVATAHDDQKFGFSLASGAADEAVAGKLDEHFPLYAWQTGSGTQSNMNVNEVLANRANEVLGEKRGGYAPIHPNDHVNMAQSTNDVIPTAIRLACLMELGGLEAVFNELAKAFEKKGKAFDQVLKSGRTHLQDAMPIRLGQELDAYAGSLRRGLKRVVEAAEPIRPGVRVGIRHDLRQVLVDHVVHGRVEILIVVRGADVDDPGARRHAMYRLDIQSLLAIPTLRILLRILRPLIDTGRHNLHELRRRHCR